jgi:hypothetical protein
VKLLRWREPLQPPPWTAHWEELQQKELSLPIDERFPQRTRDRFEKALTQLVEDRQIEAWQYKAEVQLPARHWLGTWLEQSITVSVASTKHLPGEQEDEEKA